MGVWWASTQCHAPACALAAVQTPTESIYLHECLGFACHTWTDYGESLVSGLGYPSVRGWVQVWSKHAEGSTANLSLHPGRTPH
eukprot:5348653-Amphidinium_carterae.1